MSEIILLASAHTYRLQAFLDAAKKLGLMAVPAVDVPQPLQAESRYPLMVDYQSFEGSLQAIRRYAGSHPVTAILGLDESGVMLAARASQALGLAHNPPEAIRAAQNKFEMRQKFAQAGVSSPKFREYTLADDPHQLAAQAEYPCVLKPTAMSGSRGVMRADSPPEFLARHARLAALLRAEGCDRFLVEDYLPGREIALEGILQHGKLRLLAIFDKPDPLDGPFFEETIYITPSRLPEGVQQAIARTGLQAARALGLQTGPVHAEMRVDARGPWMLEMAARSIGGLCSQTLQYGVDTSLESLILQNAVGLSLDYHQPPDIARGVMMIPIPEGGILQSVSGQSQAEAVPGVERVEITHPLHTRLVPLPEGSSYLGFIFAKANTPAEVESALRQSHACLQFEIFPELRVF